VLLIQGGHKMKQLDYARLADDCSKQADAMKPGPERDALIAKAKENGKLDHIAGASAACG
jgi:hypothetical protein